MRSIEPAASAALPATTLTMGKPVRAKAKGSRAGRGRWVVPMHTPAHWNPKDSWGEGGLGDG